MLVWLVYCSIVLRADYSAYIRIHQGMEGIFCAFIPDNVSTAWLNVSTNVSFNGNPWHPLQQLCGIGWKEMEEREKKC